MATTVDLVYAERLCVLCEALTGKALASMFRDLVG